MLNHITIKNLAVVDFLELELNTGFSVLTGETGAGKSILIDALGLVLGDRAEAAAVRYGSDRADINAEFELNDPQITQWLSENELDDPDNPAACLIRRTINAKGRSRGFVNGQPVPLQVLRELGEKLVNIHGQNTHQALLKTDEQRLLLDNFAGSNATRKALNRSYQQWQKKSAEYNKLKQDTSERNNRLDLLRFQVQELGDFDLQQNELPQLEEEHKRLSNASRLLETSQSAYYQLSEDEHSIASQISSSLNDLTALGELDNQLNPVLEMLNNALIQIDEASSELRHYIDRLELDPERLHWLDQRIAGIYDLARKHHIEADELYAHAAILKQELQQLENADIHLESLEKELEICRKDYFILAEKLTKEREKASQLLAEQVMLHIHELGMQHCIFEIRVQGIDTKQPQLHGMEVIEFYVTTNPGQPLRPLSKVVSGGELSRISLAIQVVTAQFSEIPTLIFDEVDVGIGGGIAEMVGKKLRLLGSNSQVLCVTHQAQVASQAHCHYFVEKHSDQESTKTSIKVLENKQRIEEISRMLGGVKITEQTRSHAREMLALALSER